MEERLIQHFEDSFDRILIHDDSWDTPVADRIRKLFSIQKVQRTSGKVYENSGTLTAEEFNKSKRQILVTKHKGSFFKRCPGAKPGLVCCNYFVLNLGLQCNMNCSYCYLQSYINTPYLTIYSNIDDAKNEIKEIADQYPNLHYRVGTGETIDSLSMDPITHYSKDLIAFFKNYPNWILELKTKSSFVDHFLNESHAGNVLVSWSINPQYVISKEEHGTASLEERLSSAKKCVDRGFKIAFHFDPMIFHENWKENYGDLIDQIQNRFQPSEVDLIT
ncbi:MAG: hypothetical protein KDD25_08785, partial [Bdellovibrionales bacterium]|nr:hypothetical protein [Bdellovibrionales bacterium]